MLVAVFGLTSAVAAQPSTPTPNTWINLPKSLQQFPITDPNPVTDPQPENLHAGDSEILDVLVNGHVRFWYTTNGHYLKNVPGFPDGLHSGRLRPVDLRAPLPSPLPGTEWPQGSTGNENWIINPPVANWNQALDGVIPPPPSPPYSKRNSLVGMLSKNGVLFVAGASRNRAELEANGQMAVEQWNGLSVLDGAADPSTAFSPVSGELYSFGGAESAGMLRTAVPEGVAYTSMRGAGQFLFVDNYCGTDGGGTVLVQRIHSLMNIQPNARFYLQLYELLGDYVDTSPLPQGPLGFEVCRGNFTCPLGTDLRPSCPPQQVCGNDTIHGGATIGGNKIRPVIVVDVPANAPWNAGKKFLIIGMNLDPMDLATYGGNLIPLDLPKDPMGNPVSELLGHDRDDGRYDYIAIIDITLLIATVPNPVLLEGHWMYDDAAKWKEHTRFLRLPPDMPPGWQWGATNNPPLVPGHDWSEVTIPHPTGAYPAAKELIVGSGTPKTLVADPDGRFVYVVTSDQGQENVAENATLFDGGWHVPHIYVIDLWAGNFANQNWLNNYSSNVASYRFNKVITHTFPDGVVNSVLVKSTIPGMKLTESVNPLVPTIGKTRASGALVDVDLGTIYPGEEQLDPTARTRMALVRNANFVNAQKWLYIGTTGQTQPENPLDVRTVGAVLVLNMDGHGQPVYHATLKLNQSPSLPYQVAGLEVRQADGTFIGWPASGSRNVVFITALSGLSYDNDPQDRLVLIEDLP